MDSYFQNLDIIIKDIVNKLHNELDTILFAFDINNNNSINSFFELIDNKIAELNKNRLVSLKNSIKDIDDIDYEEIISDDAKTFMQDLSIFYQKTIKKISDELTNDKDDFTKNRINNYLGEIFYQKFVTKIEEVLSFNNKVLYNNYLANCERINNINQKTLK